MVMPITGLPLRGSSLAHSSHLESCLAGSTIFSTVPEITPSFSVMRTRDLTLLVASSMVFHVPTGDIGSASAAIDTPAINIVMQKRDCSDGMGSLHIGSCSCLKRDGVRCRPAPCHQIIPISSAHGVAHH